MYEETVRGILPGAIRRPLFRALGTVYPKADWAPKFLRAKETLQGCARDSLEGYFHTVSVVPESLRPGLFSAEFHRSLQGYHAIEVFRRHAKNAQTGDPLSLVQYLDFKTYLPGDILTKVDRASMAHSLEVRVPLLDHEFVEWAAHVPPDLKLKRREGKYVFKKALENRLPHDVLYRPKKGFAVPLARWFRGPLAERVRTGVLESRLAECGLFDVGALRRIVDAHGTGVSDYSAPLWSLLMFEAFLRQLDAPASRLS
jgi:asparagine synthase (glutamine-hydrolysing)